MKIVYNGSANDYNLDEIKQEIAEFREIKPEQVSDNDVDDYIYETIQQDWEFFISDCEDEENIPVVVTGYFMSWKGPQEGGKVYPNLKQAVRNIILNDSSPVFSFNDDNVFVLDETHHDAPVSGNHYEFRVLTKKGNSYYQNHKEDDRRELCEHLINTEGLTRNVNPKIFGMQ